MELSISDDYDIDVMSSEIFGNKIDGVLLNNILQIDSQIAGDENLQDESQSIFNPDDFLNDVGTKINYSNPSSSPQDISRQYLNLETDAFNIETPPLTPPESTPIQPSYTPQNDGTIKILQGALIPLATVPLNTIQVGIKQIDSVVTTTGIPLNDKVEGGILIPAQKYSSASIITTSTVNKKKVLPKTESGHCNDNKLYLDKMLSNTNCTIKGMFMSERAMKKQQRMIKNRESASLSRKKKKDYVVSLEHKVNELSFENRNLRNEILTLREQLSTCQCRNAINYIHKAVTPHRKNTAIVLAMIFMVSMSFGNFNTLFLNGNIQKDEIISTGRNRSHIGRRLLWNTEMSVDNIYYPNATNDVKYPICPVSVNQTENVRLASELRRWIAMDEKSNSSSPQKDFRLNYIPGYMEYKSNIRSIYKENKNIRSYAKKRKILLNSMTSMNKASIAQNIDKNQMEVFKPKKSEGKYSKLLKEIGRRDDTFYVLSFNSDHILLSAAAHNKSFRPKMAFMLPTGDSYLDDQITLMQIDCEVVNTSIIQLKRKYIPDHLQSQLKDHVQEERNNTGEHFNIKANLNPFEIDIENYKEKRTYKPYFIDKSHITKENNNFNGAFLP